MIASTTDNDTIENDDCSDIYGSNSYSDDRNVSDDSSGDDANDDGDNDMTNINSYKCNTKKIVNSCIGYVFPNYVLQIFNGKSDLGLIIHNHLV
jgi:hypothetical protein